MDKDQFDKLAKALASGLTRRRALKGALAAGFAGLTGLPRRIAAQANADVASLEAEAATLLKEYVWDSSDPFDARAFDLLSRIAGAGALAAADQESLAAEVESLANAYYAHFGAEDVNGVDQGGAAVAVSATAAVSPYWACIRRCIWNFLLCLLGCRGPFRRLCIPGATSSSSAA